MLAVFFSEVSPTTRIRNITNMNLFPMPGNYACNKTYIYHNTIIYLN